MTDAEGRKKEASKVIKPTKQHSVHVHYTYTLAMYTPVSCYFSGLFTHYIVQIVYIHTHTHTHTHYHMYNLTEELPCTGLRNTGAALNTCYTYTDSAQSSSSVLGGRERERGREKVFLGRGGGEKERGEGRESVTWPRLSTS